MAPRAPTTEPRADARIEAAVALFRGRELAAAINACEALMAEAHAAPAADADADNAVEAQAAYWAARSARRQEHPDAALRYVYAGLAAARRGEPSPLECLLRAELVHVLSALGQNKDALEEADALLQRAEALQHPVGRAAAQEALAGIYWMTNDWELGLQAYTTALELACACDHLELRVLCTLGLAACEEGVAQWAGAAGRADEAEARIRRSVQLQRDSGTLAAALGDGYLVMYSQLNCACSLHSLGALDEAKAAFEACLADPSREPVHGNALAVLGRIALEQGDPQAALPLLLRGLEISERLNKLYPTLVALQTLVDAHEAVGDTAAALKCMRRFHALHVKNASDKARLLARAMSVKYDTERANAAAQAQRQRADRLERSNADLASEAALHERAAMEDALTGVANRRRFDQVLQTLAQPGAPLRPCSVALMDVDQFKLVNDRYSHLVGDEVLRRIGALLSFNCRRNDLAARYGGEEFVLLATDVRRDEMQQLCERIRHAIEHAHWTDIRAGMHVTVSIGVARHDEITTLGSGAAVALLALADARLYAAKAGGRNQVCDQGPGALPVAR
jgi:diguanylate cyclase (GGDEF)-like protein